jgi:hypothetical protein
VRKWDAVVPALDETIKATQTGIFWGLELFPEGSQTCSANVRVVPDLALNNHAAMTQAIDVAAPNGSGTPTRAAIDGAVAHLSKRMTPNPKYIVLATDGEPNCSPGRPTNDSDATAAVAAVTNAAAAGFNTFVIGIADSTRASDTLNRMAVEGKQPRTGDTKYYMVMSRDQLVAALGEITGQVGTCSFPLNPLPPVPENVAVNVGGTRVAKDITHAGGWDYGAGMKTIQLFGAACDMVKSGASKQVQIIYGCPQKPIE